MTNQTLTLYWKDIKYGIDQETWKAAKVQMAGDANAEARNDAQTGGNSFDVNYCRRKVEEGLMNLQNALHDFFVGYKSGTGKEATSAVEATDNTLDQTSTVWQIELSLDDRRNVNEKLLAVEMNKYLVLNVCQEWAKMAMPAMVTQYMDRLLVEENRIKAICYRKEAPDYASI